jgi:hypothetical protein
MGSMVMMSRFSYSGEAVLVLILTDMVTCSATFKHPVAFFIRVLPYQSGNLSIKRSFLPSAAHETCNILTNQYFISIMIGGWRK